MLIGGIVVICVILFLLALVAPRLARKPHAATNRTLGTGAAAVSHSPGVFGRWLPKPFRASQKAAGKSTAAGGKAHRKIAEKL